MRRKGKRRDRGEETGNSMGLRLRVEKGREGMMGRKGGREWKGKKRKGKEKARILLLQE
jgi:hypothetical protein